MDLDSLMTVNVVIVACFILLLVDNKRGICNLKIKNPRVLKDRSAYSFTGLNWLFLLHPSGIPVLAAARGLKAFSEAKTEEAEFSLEIK